MFGVVCTCAWRHTFALGVTIILNIRQPSLTVSPPHITPTHPHNTHACTHMHTTHTCHHTHACTRMHTHTHILMECVQVGKTALYYAADRGHEDVVELLLEANADSDLPKKVIQTYQTILYSLSLWYVHTSVRMSWPAWPAQLVTRTAYCYCHHICLLSCPHFAFHLLSSKYVCPTSLT